MRVPFSWLKRLVEVPDDPYLVADKLRYLGVPVEEVLEEGIKGDNILIGEVLKVEKHPNADKLLVTEVDFNGYKKTILTAAKNVQEGDIVPVALEGAVLGSGIRIQPRKLRGILSEGMFCSPEELKMDDVVWYDRREILILSRKGWDNYAEWKELVGKELKEVVPLSDHVFEIESFANRPDLFSIIGIAYEAAYAFKTEVKLPESLVEPEEEVDYPLSIEILDEDCRRYQGRIIEGVKVKPSPLWVQQLLSFAGIRPINVVVDVTNWVLLEMGQPLHAFDYHKVPEGKVIIRSAREGERILALDGNEYALSPEDLVIADKEKPIAIAGVIGGEESAITEDSTVVLLESANFHPARVRRTSLRLGIRTESSIRFEKDLPISNVELGSSRASLLLKEWAGGRLVKKLDLMREEPKEVKVVFNVEEVRRTLGKPLPEEEVKEILTLTGFKVRELEKGTLEVTPPPHRRDISIPADIVEEIARLKGYDYWGEELPKIVPTGYESLYERRIEEVREIPLRMGFFEVITWSLTSKELLELWDLNPQEHLRVQNPLSSEREYLRRWIYPELMEVVRRNVSYGESYFKLFEVGRVFQPSEGEPPFQEYPKLSLAILTPKDSDPMAIYEVREVFQRISDVYNLSLEVVNSSAPKWGHPYAFAKVKLNGEEVGFIGEVHPEHLQALELENYRVFIGEVDLRPIVNLKHVEKVYKPISKYQKIYRDLSLLVPEEENAGIILEIAEDVFGDLLEEAYLYDYYRDLSIPEGMVSYTFRFVLRPRERALKEEEIKEAFRKLLQKVEERIPVQLRGKI